MNSKRMISAAMTGGLLMMAATLANAAGMKVSSSSFSEGGSMPKRLAGDSAECGGKGVSPAVSWSHLPKGTKSVAIFMIDPDGAKGLGVTHWVAYNIAASPGHLAEGRGQSDGTGIAVGKNSAGAPAYRGMCPPVGDVPHHYVLSVVASALEPGFLPKGLSRDELLAALKGHTFEGQSVVGRYVR
jgi:Raf kinase inhibitor-like YbhB/YbcL family protein